MSVCAAGTLAALIAATACSPLPPVPVALARAQLKGRTAEQVAACMGPPPIERSDQGAVLWSYAWYGGGSEPLQTPTDPGLVEFDYAALSSGPEDYGLGAGLGVTQGPLAPAGCVVNIVLRNGRVDAVAYIGPNGHRMIESPDCTALVHACVPVG